MCDEGQPGGDKRRTPDQILAALASRQHGVARASQLAAANLHTSPMLKSTRGAIEAVSKRSQPTPAVLSSVRAEKLQALQHLLEAHENMERAQGTLNGMRTIARIKEERAKPWVRRAQQRLNQSRILLELMRSELRATSVLGASLTASGALDIHDLLADFRALHEAIERHGPTQFASTDEARVIWDVLWAVEFCSPEAEQSDHPEDWYTPEQVLAIVKRAAAQLAG